MQEAKSKTESRLLELASLIKIAQLKISHHSGEVRFRVDRIEAMWSQIAIGQPLDLSWVDAMHADACALKAAKDQLEALQREERELRSKGQDVGQSLESGDR